jgi:hypothetical protein
MRCTFSLFTTKISLASTRLTNFHRSPASNLPSAPPAAPPPTPSASAQPAPKPSRPPAPPACSKTPTARLPTSKLSPPLLSSVALPFFLLLALIPLLLPLALPLPLFLALLPRLPSLLLPLVVLCSLVLALWLLVLVLLLSSCKVDIRFEVFDGEKKWEQNSVPGCIQRRPLSLMIPEGGRKHYFFISF